MSTETVMPGPNATLDTCRTVLHVLDSVARTVLLIDVDAVAEHIASHGGHTLPGDYERLITAARAFRDAMTPPVEQPTQVLAAVPDTPTKPLVDLDAIAARVAAQPATVSKLPARRGKAGAKRGGPRP